MQKNNEKGNPVEAPGKSTETVDKSTRTAGEVRDRIRKFAMGHDLLLADPQSLEAHIAKYLELGHCPCVESRKECPCSEALHDIEKSGRCACGIFLTPRWIDKLWVKQLIKEE